MSRRQASADEFASYQRRVMAAAQAVFGPAALARHGRTGRADVSPSVRRLTLGFWKRLAIAYKLLACAGNGVRRFRLWVRTAVAVFVTPLRRGVRGRPGAAGRPKGPSLVGLPIRAKSRTTSRSVPACRNSASPTTPWT